MMRIRAAVALLFVAALTAGCSSNPSPADKPSDSGASETTTAAENCTPEGMATKTKGKLTVATGEVVFEPWMKDDNPENGEGFESALVYALAEKLGYKKEDVSWVRTGFDEAVAPGEKDWDFNLQQYSITDERKQVVDFSAPYYTVQQAIVAAKDSKIKDARTVADLVNASLGAHVGSTSLNYIDDVIKPATPAKAYDDNVAAKAAIDAGQVDGVLFDLPTAYYVTAVEMPDTSIVGVLPQADGGEEMGLLMAKGSPIKACVDQAMGQLDADGVLTKLRDTWLTAGGDIPTLER